MRTAPDSFASASSRISGKAACTWCRPFRRVMPRSSSNPRIWVMRRTAVINQIRGLLLERGITLRKGRHHVHAALPLILEDADAKLSGAVRMLLAQLKLDLDQLAARIDEADAVIRKTAHENEACRRLVAIPGIGPGTATGLIAAIGNGGAFPQRRDFAAWRG